MAFSENRRKKPPTPVLHDYKLSIDKEIVNKNIKQILTKYPEYQIIPLDEFIKDIESGNFWVYKYGFLNEEEMNNTYI